MKKQKSKHLYSLVSLFFAGGAVLAHFGGLGTPMIVAFSLSSGAVMIPFVGACVRSTSNSIAIRKQIDHPIQPIDQVEARIKEIFESDADIVEQLQPLFTEAENDFDALKRLTSFVIKNSGLSFASSVSVLEKLTWLGPEILPRYLRSFIIENLDNYMEMKFTKGTLTIKTASFFSHNDSMNMPHSLAAALGNAIRLFGWITLKRLHEQENRSAKFEIKVVIESIEIIATKAATRISPLLSHLHEIPGLTFLEFASHPESYSQKGVCFMSDCVKELESIYQSNLCLREIKFDAQYCANTNSLWRAKVVANSRCAQNDDILAEEYNSFVAFYGSEDW